MEKGKRLRAIKSNIAAWEELAEPTVFRSFEKAIPRYPARFRGVLILEVLITIRRVKYALDRATSMCAKASF
ncbi:Hypothetical protein PHPALM_13780 [Phytophthora palmivora]|uniref:Uncharacterized protein n=1 Tax=Phytophthora palmivora TaxID=4796 RepID=A0A2P4XWQ4_9STRA|nr:Hypothetical protein PHPALM_13780 [Phytophthora palmivora]